MTIEATFQWSEIARNPRDVAAAVEREGTARLDRRGEGQPFILMTLSRYATNQSGIRFAERFLRTAVARSFEHGDLNELLVEAFPWLRFIPEEHRAAFVKEFMDTFQACTDLDVWTPMQRLMREWKATAAVYADPELAAKLKGPFDDDLGPALPPEVVGDAGWAE